ncbi:MAG: UvrD-helicase domain-containing protein [Patescibacteria group bacterium]
MDIFHGLNPEQKIAVETTEGPLLVLAGAGSGKTRVIAHRIAHIVRQGTAPDRILAVTFTNKAAGEMRERIHALLGTVDGSGSVPFIGTFHALGIQILRTHGSRIGLSDRFSIADQEDSLKLIKEIMVGRQLDPDIYDPQRFRGIISQLKNEMTPVSQLGAAGFSSPYEEQIAGVYVGYEAALHKMQNCDFDDLLIRPVQLLKDHADVREYWQDKWKYIHIDEYQDTNVAQYQLSRLLSARHHNICVVGDIDQAIYSWRGADWRNILNFERDFEGATVIMLEQNYRSTKVILEAARSVIARNSERKPIALRTDNAEGEKVRIKILEDERKEAAMVVSDIADAIRVGYKHSDIAILFRTNAQSRAIEEALMKRAIPYRLVSGVRFYDRKEVKDVLAYLKRARNPEDGVSERRVLNMPPRGIGKVLLYKYIAGISLSASEQKKIEEFTRIITEISEKFSTTNLPDLITFIIERAGYVTYFSKDAEGKERLANMRELVSVAAKHRDTHAIEIIDDFLQEVELMSDQDLVDTTVDAVHLLTAHAAKGLEFKVVIVTGLEEGLFPHTLAQEEGMIEEERRLFYVAVTRARERIILTLTMRRMMNGEVAFNDPSRFIGEIPEHLVDIIIPEYPSKSYEEETIHYF